MSLTADIQIANHVVAFPGVGSRLLAGVAERESLESYQRAGGYQPIEDPERLLEAVRQAGLRGRGGAAFPTWRKLQTVRSGNDVPVVVANGEEGEPASVKDRWLLRHRPHLVLDGLRLAAHMVGTVDVHVYVSDEAGARSVERAIAELAHSDAWNCTVRLTQVDPAYVAGEETAAVRAINGGPALPSDKPPRPFEEGVDGRPTLISNVETLANLALIQRLGASEYRTLGTTGTPGTFLLTLTGVSMAGLYEVPFGVTLREVLATVGHDEADVVGFLMGGYFSGVAGRHVLDVPLDYDALIGIGSGLGCGAIAVIGKDVCPVAVSAGVMAYFARENAGQCGSCFNGTAAMSAVLTALHDHRADDTDVKRLRDWSVFLRGRGACGTLDGATNIAASLFREFPELVETHLEDACAVCEAAGPVTDPPYAIGLLADA